jgi:hypothetical protein
VESVLTRKRLAHPTKGNLPPHLTPGNPGNSGGKEGRSGRRSLRFTNMVQKLLLNAGPRRALRKILRNPEHPHFATMWRALRDTGYPVTKNLDVKASITLEDLLHASYDAEDGHAAE